MTAADVDELGEQAGQGLGDGDVVRSEAQRNEVGIVLTVYLPFVEPGIAGSNRSIQFWVPLDDVDHETGCMQFVPGYHTRPLLEHQVASGNPGDEGRLLAMVDPDAQVDLTRAVVAAIPAGGCSMHAAGTPHYTGPNRSADRHRPSYILNVAPS